MCAGVPVRTKQIEDMEFLTYFSGGDSCGYFAGGTSSSAAVGTVSMSRRYCEVTFILRNGVIESLNYIGRTGGKLTKGEQCAFVLQNCIPE